jgi:hypothetical protein
MYWRVKAKCLRFALHFVVCTLGPERHTHESLHCPECGSHDGNFGIWREQVEGDIVQDVPGKDDARSTPWPNQVARRGR